MRERTALGGTPVFSVITPVYDTPLGVLAETIESVLAQTFEDWELILVDDRSPDSAVRDVLRSYADKDPRIKVIERETNGHIVAASNDGVEAARGAFLVLLDHDDLLTADALERNAAVIVDHEDVDYIYSDEDKIDQDGRRFDPFLKPTWSPERLRSQMYTCHLSVLRTSLVREVGAFREGFDGSQDYDLVLRVTERARRVEHIPEILYHWRVVPGSAAGDANAKPYAHDAARRALQEHLDRVGIVGRVDFGPLPGLYRTTRRLDPDLRVSLVIATMGQTGLIWGARRHFVVDAVRSMLEHTEHENLEVIVVYDPPTPEAVLVELREIAGERLVLVPFSRPFVHGEKMNIGVLHSTGDRIVLLNDDIEIISDRWLEELVAPLDEPDVGMTGAKLYFSNSTVQHAGHAYAYGHYFHPFYRSPRSGHDVPAPLLINREVSGVTAACSAMRRETYFEVGGFTEQLPTHFNDVDLCYKVRSTGRRIVWMANVELYHFESVSRGRDPVPAAEWRWCLARWGKPGADPYLPTHEPSARS
ncbi:glycosyltransferase family 2 protein [Nocardioides pantholopis]|uniref:glycosyltransferase family 2 protein n=1 Tax=Nocardioides pantholopis TaxID=2483798 RepID=UPI000FD9A8F9|nr:glycosyltransferase [Nocardioides pantholopis]